MRGKIAVAYVHRALPKFSIINFQLFICLCIHSCLQADLAMMSSVLLRPKRPLPRRFNRRVSPTMRSFAAKRHKRGLQRRREKSRRFLRKIVSAFQGLWLLIRRWWHVASICVVLACTAVMFASPILTVREIRVLRGQGRVDVAAIQKELRPLFGRHLLFVSSHEVVNLVRNVVPDLDTVTVNKEYPSQLEVRITVQPLAARLMFEEPKVAQPPPAASSSSAPSQVQPLAQSGAAAVEVAPVQKHDYLTVNGMYIAAFTAASGATLPAIKVVDWGVRPAPGSRLFDAEFLERMQGAKEAIEQEFGQKVGTQTVYLRAREFHLSLGKISLWFDTQGTLEDQLQRYRTFLRTVGLKQVGQYVDLRLNGRVVYR